MDSLLSILQRKLREGVENPEELGRELARSVPQNWKITVYAVSKAGIEKASWGIVFRAFFEEQQRKPKKFKGKGSKKGAEVDDGLDQLDFGLD